MKQTHVLLACSVLAIASFSFHAQEDKGSKKKIKVALPIQREVAEYVDCTGRTSPAMFLTIMPRVTGYIVEAPFKEGAQVKAGDVLFKIDAGPFQTQLKAADGQRKAAQSQLRAAQLQFEVARAKLKYDKVSNDRFKELARKQPGVVSARELDQYQANEDQSVANVQLAAANIGTAEANVFLAEANHENAQIHLDWTSIRAPIDGHVGRYLFSVGNLAKENVSKLTTVMSIDPMYVYFDVPERTLLRLLRSAKDGKPIAAAKVHLGLADEDGFPHIGTINFVDNQLQAGSATILMRASFTNPRTPGGGHLLLPEMTARLRFTIGQPQARLLVRSDIVRRHEILNDFVYVLNGTKVEARIIKVGQAQPGGLVVVEEGLQKDDRVVLTEFVAGEAVRANNVEQVVMPTNRQTK